MQCTDCQWRSLQIHNPIGGVFMKLLWQVFDYTRTVNLVLSNVYVLYG